LGYGNHPVGLKHEAPGGDLRYIVPRLPALQPSPRSQFLAPPLLMKYCVHKLWGHTRAHMDCQPENIVPPAASGGKGMKVRKLFDGFAQKSPWTNLHQFDYGGSKPYRSWQSYQL